MCEEQSKIAVSEKALMSRINRVLKKEGVRLKKTRGRGYWYGYLGRYYIWHDRAQAIELPRINLEELAKEKHCMLPGEFLADTPMY